MDKTVRALTGLSAVDDQLSEREALEDGLAPVLQARRAAFRDAIPGVFLAAYDDLGRVGRRPVVVPVRGAHCGGCYLRLPPHLDSAIRRRQSLWICPHCHRVLYSSARAEDGENAKESKHKRGDHPGAGDRTSKRTPRNLRVKLARQEPNAPDRRRPALRKTERRGGLGSTGASPAKADPVER